RIESIWQEVFRPPVGNIFAACARRRGERTCPVNGSSGAENSMESLLGLGLAGVLGDAVGECSVQIEKGSSLAIDSETATSMRFCASAEQIASAVTALRFRHTASR